MPPLRQGWRAHRVRQANLGPQAWATLARQGCQDCPARLARLECPDLPDPQVLDCAPCNRPHHNLQLLQIRNELPDSFCMSLQAVMLACIMNPSHLLVTHGPRLWCAQARRAPAAEHRVRGFGACYACCPPWHLSVCLFIEYEVATARDAVQLQVSGTNTV